MSRLTLCFLFVSFLNTGAGNELSLSNQQLPAGTPEARGEWIARRAEDRETGRDARFAMRMRLSDRQGRVRERALTLLALRAATGDRTLIRFAEPNDIKGTAFLVWEHPNADDERFLFLPALGRARRIASDETQGSFVGSDFTYEDIGGREFESYAYRMLDDRAAWTAADGTTHKVYTLESRSRDANARFPRVVSLVRQDNFVIVKADIYNKRDEIQKTYEVRRLDRIRPSQSREKTDGYWTALEMRMADLLARTSTELVMERVEYDVGLTADHFSRRELERGGGG